MKKVSVILSKAQICIILTSVFVANAWGQTPDTLESQVHADREICPRLIHIIEQKRLIPYRLLLSVATVESAKKDTKLPWPWTINVNGKGEFFASADLAISRVKQLLSAGTRNIDIGCMQVNHKYHRDSFSSLEIMFDPVHNVAFASTFLLSLYERHGSWSDAVRHYHSSDPNKHQRYHQNVMQTWDRISPPPVEGQQELDGSDPDKSAIKRSLAPLSKDDKAIRSLIDDTQRRYELTLPETNRSADTHVQQ